MHAYDTYLDQTSREHGNLFGTVIRAPIFFVADAWGGHASSGYLWHVYLSGPFADLKGVTAIDAWDAHDKDIHDLAFPVKFFVPTEVSRP